MVEINNQRKAFLDMLAWSEGIDNGRQKNQKSWLWRHCRRRAIYWLLRSPSQTCHAKPKTQINRRRTIPASSPLVDVTASSLAWKTSLRKSQDAVALQIKERGALPMIDRGDIRQAIDRCSTSGLHCRALVMVSSSIRLDSLIAKFKEAGGTVREIDVWAESPRLSPLWLSASSPACHGLLITQITLRLQSPARQKCQRTEAGERGNYWHADASAWCCCARCKIHEGVSWC